MCKVMTSLFREEDCSKMSLSVVERRSNLTSWIRFLWVMIVLVIYFVLALNSHAMGNDSLNNEREIALLRKNVANKTNKPGNIVDEYRLATLIRQRLDPNTHQYIVTDETRQIFEGIVEKYNHKDYYSADLPNTPRSEQIMIPECAIIAASYQKDQDKARQYYLKAMECLSQTYQQRKNDWETATVPEKPAEDSPFGALMEVAKWESRMSRWQQRKLDAEQGNVLHKIELRLIKSAVELYLLSYLSEYGDRKYPAYNQDNIRKATIKITEDFPDSPISDYAFEYSNIIVSVLDRIRMVTK
jgi:hypothetical protein